METVTSRQTLMHYANELGQARLAGDKDKIAEAEKIHDSYVKICLESDRMIGLNINFN